MKTENNSRWGALLDSLGLRSAKTGEPATEPQLDQLREHIDRLENENSQLAAENARLVAGATKTLPKEDPSPQESRLSPNEEAYLSDLKGFKS